MATPADSKSPRIPQCETGGLCTQLNGYEFGSCRSPYLPDPLRLIIYGDEADESE